MGNMKRKREKLKDSATVIANAEACEDSHGFTKKKEKDSMDLTGGLVELIAKYLWKRGLSKTLSALVSETQCKNNWETQTLDLEDIYYHYSNQSSRNSSKHKTEKRNLGQAKYALSTDSDKQNVDVMSQEQGLKTIEGITVSKTLVNTKEVSTGSARTFIVCSVAKSGALKEGLSQSYKSEDFYGDNQNKHVKKKRKSKGVEKSTEPDLDNISAKEQHSGLPSSGDREKPNSTKDTTEPSKSSNKLENVLGLVEPVDKSLKVPKEKRRKKKTSEEKDSGGNELEKVCEVDESLHGSLKVPKERRKKTTSKEKDSEDGDQQGSGKKNKKQKKVLKKKLHSAGLHVAHEEETDAGVKDPTGVIGKLLDDVRDPISSQAEEVVEEKAVKALETSVRANGFESTSIDEQEEGINGKENGGNIAANLKKIRNQISDVPTTTNAFRRVKVEEVKFTDYRLQDNSYWAKGGAENGYGAKAEGVLGQVRGKDFRHEKTKKKRGSYKGGMIDLQSHSVKFNYSDQE